MPHTVVDPYSQVASVLESAIAAEFTDVAYMEIHHDRIHESLGSDGKTHVGISPDDQTSERIELVQDVTIQYYGPFNLQIDPFQEVDPRLISNKAERLRQKLAEVRTVGTSQVWFFDVL